MQEVLRQKDLKLQELESAKEAAFSEADSAGTSEAEALRSCREEADLVRKELHERLGDV